MNLLLAELFNSIPPEFSVKNQEGQSIRFHYKHKEILVQWHSNGQPSTIAYIKDGYQLSRPTSEGPAFQEWDDNGKLLEISYYENGGLWHRPTSEGPARQHWKADGSLIFAEYWENGNFIK